MSFVAQTWVLDGYDCRTCSPSIQRQRGCSLKGMPRPPCPAFEDVQGATSRQWWDCPEALKTQEHRGLFRLYQHWRDNRPIYPCLLDYPNRLLRALEVIDAVIRPVELQRIRELAGQGGVG